MPMPKYLLFPIAGACLFFSSQLLGADDSWYDASLRPEVFWGHGNEDIPKPDVSCVRWEDDMGVWEEGVVLPQVCGYFFCLLS